MKSNKTMLRLARAIAYSEYGISEYRDSETGETTFGYVLPKKRLNQLYKSEGFTPAAELRHIQVWKELGAVVEHDRFFFVAPTVEDVDQIQALEDLKGEHELNGLFDYKYIGAMA